MYFQMAVYLKVQNDFAYCFLVIGYCPYVYVFFSLRLPLKSNLLILKILEIEDMNVDFFRNMCQ